MQMVAGAAQVVQAAAAAVWGCATSSRTRHLLTEIGAVEALLTMLQTSLAMDTASGTAADASDQPAAAQTSHRDLLQVRDSLRFVASRYVGHALLPGAARCPVV